MQLAYNIIAALSAIIAVNAAQCPEATLASGVVLGTTTSLASATATVNQFLGVPFAAPPKRFSPPIQPKAWKKPLDTSIRSPACLQQINCEYTPSYIQAPIDIPCQRPGSKKAFYRSFI
jgi:hypothetical protein